MARFYNYSGPPIVTAAVYRGFNQELAPHHLTFRHRAGVTPYTSTFVLAECCVFVKQSQPPFLCDLFRLPLYAFTYQRRTFSRRYGANLPSSFTRVLSSALEYSSCPPVSVCGTVDSTLQVRGFFWEQGVSSSRRACASLRHHASAKTHGFAKGPRLHA